MAVHALPKAIDDPKRRMLKLEVATNGLRLLNLIGFLGPVVEPMQIKTRVCSFGIAWQTETIMSESPRRRSEVPILGAVHFLRTAAHTACKLKTVRELCRLCENSMSKSKALGSAGLKRAALWWTGQV